MFIFQKNQQFWFSSFFTTTSIRTWYLANLRPVPAPHGAPLMTTHTTTYLYVFSIQQALEWDFLPKSWPFLHYFSFQAPTSILALFGPFWPTLARWSNSGGPWSGHQWCFPTYIHHAPCKKPRPAQGDDMRSRRGQWSMIPHMAFWAAAPKGMKSCRTQGDFRLSQLRAERA